MGTSTDPNRTASSDGAAASTPRAGTGVPQCAPLREERDTRPNPKLDPRRDAESKVDESSNDSFPASDPPSWTPVQGTSDAAQDEQPEADDRARLRGVEFEVEVEGKGEGEETPADAPARPTRAA